MSANGSPAFPTNIVDVAGYRLAMACAGTGRPTVILDAGMGDDHDIWREVQAAASQFAEVCSYDRAGLGQSEPRPAHRTSQTAATELHALLGAAWIPDPYILVGHSFGGYVVRLFTSQYPLEVAGVVLVDSAQPDVDMLALLPPEAPDESDGIRQLRQVLKEESLELSDPERIDPVASAAEVRAVTSLGDAPLVVLSRGSDAWVDKIVANFPGLPRELAATLEQVWQAQQRRLLALSTRSRQVIARHSGHYIHTDEPELVIAAIRSLVDFAQEGLL